MDSTKYTYFGTLKHNVEDKDWEVNFDNFPEAFSYGYTPAEAYTAGKEVLMLSLDGKVNFPKPKPFKKDVDFDKENYDQAFQLPFEVSKAEIASAVKHETVKKNTTIPKYLVDEAVKQDINFSKVLTEALREKLNV